MTDRPQVYDQFVVRDPDPNYRYRWCNERDRAMLQKMNVGWEVDKDGKDELPNLLPAGQAVENPAGGTIRKRGDLILMKIPRDVYEERVEKPRRQAAERQNVSIDTMVRQADEQAKKALRRAGYRDSQIRESHVFSTSDQPGFDGNR
jgi:hypothetical protein